VTVMTPEQLTKATARMAPPSRLCPGRLSRRTTHRALDARPPHITDFGLPYRDETGVIMAKIRDMWVVTIPGV
jgi:hypothetical protein